MAAFRARARLRGGTRAGFVRLEADAPRGQVSVRWLLRAKRRRRAAPPIACASVRAACVLHVCTRRRLGESRRCVACAPPPVHAAAPRPSRARRGLACARCERRTSPFQAGAARRTAALCARVTAVHLHRTCLQTQWRTTCSRGSQSGVSWCVVPTRAQRSDADTACAIRAPRRAAARHVSVSLPHALAPAVARALRCRARRAARRASRMPLSRTPPSRAAGGDAAQREGCQRRVARARCG